LLDCRYNDRNVLGSRFVVAQGGVCKRCVQPEGDSRSGFLPAGLPSLSVDLRVQGGLAVLFDYNACVQPMLIGFTRGLLLGFLPPALNFFSASAGC